MTRIGLLYVDDFHQSRSQRVGSLGLGYIAAYLKQKLPGCEVTIEITPEDLIRFQPDIIGVSSYSETLPTAVKYSRYLKDQLDIPLVLGGPHIASNPLDLPDVFDVGIVGEGEEIFLSLVQANLANAWTPQTLSHIQGLTYWQDGKLKHTGRNMPIQDMNALAHPDRKLMFAPIQRHFNNCQPILHIHTARGCPYRCTFCSAPLVNPKLRFHSPEWVIAELEQIARQFPQCRELTISDDLFTLHKRRLIELVTAIRESGFHKRFFFFCSARSNTLTEDICRLLRDMNVLVVAFGFESASDSLVRELKGTGVSEQDYQRVLDLSARFGIYAHGNFILGSQHETRQDMLLTDRFIRKNADRFASVYFTHMTPFPGTRVWDESVEAGLFDPETVDYRILNLDYTPSKSVFLNQHYDQNFYHGAYQLFKKQETFLNDRYYAEEALIKDIARQYRFQIPDQIIDWLRQIGSQKVIFVTERDPCLPELPPGLEITMVAPEDITSPIEADGVVLYHTLDRCLRPKDILKHFRDIPIISLNHHVGSLYEWGLLLLGKWEEGIYGVRHRDNRRYFTLRSLRQLMEKEAKGLQEVAKFTYTLPLDYTILDMLSTIGSVTDPDTFSYLTLWN